MPWLDNVTVLKAGPADDGKIYVALRPADNSFQRWFVAVPVVQKEMLASALTALSGGKKVQVYLSTTAENGIIRRMYVKM